MINNFFETIPNTLYRGGELTDYDVRYLKEEFKINKIVSLDLESANKIKESCKKYNINHVIVPIVMQDFHRTLISFLKKDLVELLLEDGPTYVHCKQGKDRTGLVVALLKIKHLDVSLDEAMQEANKFNFGKGINKNNLNLMIDVLLENSKKKETNTIVSLQRENYDDHRSSYLTTTKQFPEQVYRNEDHYNVSYTANYKKQERPIIDLYQQSPFKETKPRSEIPAVGEYENDTAGVGFGYTYPDQTSSLM